MLWKVHFLLDRMLKFKGALANSHFTDPVCQLLTPGLEKQNHDIGEQDDF